MFELIDFIIVRPITNILFVIYNAVGDFGLAIILFTVLVKLLTWPLIKRQLKQTKLMREIQPELVEIRKRCNGNKQLESIEMMDLYKRKGVKPMGSLWIVIIQIPIFIALFTAIRVMVTPTSADNLEKRAYPPVAKMERIEEVINLQKPHLENPEKNPYEFEPRLFGTVNLAVRPGFGSKSQIAALIFAIGASLMQYWTTKLQQSNGKKKKKGSAKETWHKMLDDAKEGKDPNQDDLNQMVSSQMAIMMPLMMLMITINLPGALCFYYLLLNIISNLQQRYILGKVEKEMDDNTDRAILKELKSSEKKIKEAEVIENKKTGTKITRIKARDTKPSKKSSKKTTKSKNTKNSDQSEKG